MQVVVARKENNVGDNDNDELKKFIKSGDIKKGNRKQF